MVNKGETTMKLSRYLAKDTSKRQTGWDKRHNEALVNPKGFEIGIVGLLVGLEEYIEQHQTRYDSALIDDYVLNKGLVKIIEGLRVFLNGEIGRLDAGTLDKVFVEILMACGQEV